MLPTPYSVLGGSTQGSPRAFPKDCCLFVFVCLFVCLFICLFTCFAKAHLWSLSRKQRLYREPQRQRVAGRVASTPTKYQHQLRGSPQLYLLFVLILILLQRQPHRGARRLLGGGLAQPQLGRHSQLDGPSHHHRSV